jgi:hypothetical protein
VRGAWLQGSKGMDHAAEVRRAPEVQAVQEVAADDHRVFRRHHRVRPAARDEQRLAGGHGDAHAAGRGVRKEAGRLQWHSVLCVTGNAVPSEVPEQ